MPVGWVKISATVALVGSHVGVGTGVTLGERSHREEKAVVEFRDGRVHQFRMPAR
jgi:hypothetical protein